MPERQPGRHVLRVPPIDLSHRLPQRFEGLEPWAATRSVDPQTLTRAVVDHEEDRRVPLSGDRALVASVPHNTSGRSTTIVPSCAFEPCACPIRVGDKRSFSRMSRNTRRGEVRTPANRSRAHTFRYPSPTHGEELNTSRIARRRSASLRAPSGPRFLALDCPPHETSSAMPKVSPRHTQLPRQRVEVFSAKNPEHDLPLLPRTPPAPVLPLPTGRDSGRPTGSLRSDPLRLPLVGLHELPLP